MTLPAACILYGQDSDFVRRARAYLRNLTRVRHVAQPDRLEAVVQQSLPALLLLDLRGKKSIDLLARLQAQWPDVLVIAFGTLRSEPLRDAAQSGIYAAEDVNLEHRQFQSLVERALQHLHVREENRALRAEPAQLPVSATHPVSIARPDSRSASLTLSTSPGALRRLDDFQPLVRRVVEDLARRVRVSRVGLFARDRPGESFRMRAGLRCLPETHQLEYEETHPLLRWFEVHAHLVYRPHLQQKEHAQRELLRRALDAVGAEVLVPLHSAGQISGWLFFGHHLTGHPFDEQTLEGLMQFAEEVSEVLESDRLSREMGAQKALVETLLGAIPPGIIACDENGLVSWCNPTAESILGIAMSEVLHRPIETAGSRIASLLRDTLENNGPLSAQQWVESHARRSVSVQTRRLLHENQPLGAVAIIQDLTPEESLREKQELMDRAAFWTDLAASMSHEVRNPLVAIKTFAQLLPERFDDPDFRRDFNEIVVQEIDRLDLIITQINNFAHPPELHFKPLDVRSPMKKAIEMVRGRTGQNGFSIETALPHDLPRVAGDETALAEAFAHLVTNAAEATHGRPKARIMLTAKPIHDGGHTSGVVVTVRDNGRGIAADLRDKIFSPFCTTKARGMGLGLPIVKRTVFDHNGRVDVDSNPQGTSVSVLLPAIDNGA